LPKKWHRNVGGGGENIWDKMLKKLQALKTTPDNATVEQIWQVHKTVYEDIQHPEWAKAVYEAYFNSRGIPY
jgi:hypothetical protein